MSKRQRRTRSSRSSQPRGFWLVAGLALAGLGGLVWLLNPSPPKETSPASPPDNPISSADASSSPAPSTIDPHPAFTNFVGSAACAECHPSQYELWKNSTHGRAGGVPGEATIIARFDGQPLLFKDATVIPTTNRAGQYVFLIDQEGQPREEVKVDAAVGGGHMHGGGTQTFFARFEDGTVRFLPFDFIRDENLWFVQLRRDNSWAPVSRDISLASDLANWPPRRVLGTLVDFSNCQNCHGSQVVTHYNVAARRYETLYHSLAINCESCHGPGQRHLQLARQPDRANLADLGMTPLATLSKDASLQVCFQCHASKVSVREGDYLPGANLDDFFSIGLAHFWSEPWLVDGRVRSFSYQANHLYSDCYLNGSMTCVDCHDPHAQTYRDVFGNPLQGKFDNGQCTGCHVSKALNPEAHSHHAPDSPGNLCTSCHMPFLQHKGVGSLLKFARSDHTIPIPRPGFDEQIGIENACQKCHADQGLDWQAQWVRTWYGEIKPHHPHIASLIEGERAQDLASAAELLLIPSSNHTMAQASGLATFIRHFLRPGQTPPEPVALERLRTLASHPDMDLRSLALMALDVTWPDPSGLRAFLEEQRTNLGDESDPVRNRWSVAADQWGSILGGQGRFAEAMLCFQKALELLPNSVVSLSNLALAQLRSGQPDLALSTLQRAIQIKPHQAALHFQLAQVHLQAQRLPEALQALESGLTYSPLDPTALRMRQLLRDQPSPPP